jgi:hypothetical protein
MSICFSVCLSEDTSLDYRKTYCFATHGVPLKLADQKSRVDCMGTLRQKKEFAHVLISLFFGLFVLNQRRILNRQAVA